MKIFNDIKNKLFGVKFKYKKGDYVLTKNNVSYIGIPIKYSNQIAKIIQLDNSSPCDYYIEFENDLEKSTWCISEDYIERKITKSEVVAYKL